MANNTTTSHELFVGWVTGPAQRGTLNLVWSCAVTVFACTWSVLHLNVPSQKDTTRTRLTRKVKWMIINLLFPEFIFSKAVFDLRLAIQDFNEFQQDYYLSQQYKRYNPRLRILERLDLNGKSERCGASCNGNHDSSHREIRLWTWEPALLPWCFRGFRPTMSCIKSAISVSNLKKALKWPAIKLLPRERCTQGLCTIKNHQISAVQNWTLEHSYLAQMGGLRFHPSLEEDGYLITESCMISPWKWRQDGPADNPLVHLALAKEDIQDKSKTDLLSKGIAIVQVEWTILNVIVRHVTSLPVTQLEIATLAFAVITVLTYLVNWWKPQDISRSTVWMPRDDCNTVSLEDMTDKRDSWARQLLLLKKRTNSVKGLDRIPNDFIWLNVDSLLLSFMMGASSLGFGGLHCLAWKADFPTMVELYCWRSASLVSAIVPAVALILSPLPGYLAGLLSDNLIRSQMNSALRRGSLDHLSPLRWMSLETEAESFCVSWAQDAQIAFVLLPKASRDWKSQPSSETIKDLKKNVDKWKRGEQELERFIQIHDCFKFFWSLWLRILMGHRTPPWKLREDWDYAAGRLQTALSRPDAPPQIWRDYEDMVNVNYNFEASLPNTDITCVEGLVRAYQHAMCHFPSMKTLEKMETMCLITTRIIPIFSIFVYTIARIIIIVLLFSTLRSVPAEVYQNTAWTRFIPNVS